MGLPALWLLGSWSWTFYRQESLLWWEGPVLASAGLGTWTRKKGEREPLCRADKLSPLARDNYHQAH